MADNRNTAEILADLLAIHISGDVAWHHVKASLAGTMDAFAVEVGSIGTTPLLHLLMGLKIKIKFTFTQWSAEVMNAIWSGNDGKNLAPGTPLPEKSVTLHPVSMGDDHSADLIFPKVNFVNPSLEHDGKGALEWVVEAWVCIDPSDLTVYLLGEEEA